MSTPEVISTPQLGENVAAYVRELIMTGQVREGEFLRVDRLASDLGVSATPVREALQALRGDGFVILQPRRGFMVASLSAQDVLDLFVVQGDVAGELAARAAVRMADEDVEAIARIQGNLDAAAKAGDPVAAEEWNHEFHRVINLAASSPKLLWLLGTVVRYAPRLFYGSIHGWSEASSEDHGDIVVACETHDAELARVTMRSHIVHAGQLLVEHLRGTGFWDEAADGPEQVAGGA